jgi:hypothetical protein
MVKLTRSWPLKICKLIPIQIGELGTQAIPGGRDAIHSVSADAKATGHPGQNQMVRSSNQPAGIVADQFDSRLV